MRVWDLRAPGCQRAYESRAAVNTVVLHPNQGELISGVRMEPAWAHGCTCNHMREVSSNQGGLLLPYHLHIRCGGWSCTCCMHNSPSRVALDDAGDQTGHIRVWDLTASACSCELVPEIGTAVRSLTVALDGSMIVAANNHGTCYVWRMMRGACTATCQRIISVAA